MKLEPLFNLQHEIQETLIRLNKYEKYLLEYDNLISYNLDLKKEVKYLTKQIKKLKEEKKRLKHK